MVVLKVTLFGGMKVRTNQARTNLKLTRSSKLLLAYLLLERHRMHSRDALAGLFWGDYNQSRARRCLNTALWRLRQAIERGKKNQNAYLMVSHTGEVGFNQESDYWLDVAVFEECVNRVKLKPIERVHQHEVEELETKIQLYISDLLDGVYTDWAIRAREYESLLHLDGLAYLMKYYKHHAAFLRSLEFGLKILDIDPLREEIHREMMHLYMETGQRALAIRQYEICHQTLSTELGISPMEETQALFAQILEQSNDRRNLPAVQETTELHEAIIYLRQAARNIKLAQEQYHNAMRRLEAILPGEEANLNK